MKCLVLNLLTLLLVLSYDEAFAAKILVLLPMGFPSHHTVCRPILRELANRGHELTILTAIEDPKAPKSVKQILLPAKKPHQALDECDPAYRVDYFSEENKFHKNQMLLWNATLLITESVLESKQFQDFLANDKTKYDLIIYETFYHDAFLPLTAKYKAPYIAISTFGNSHFINQFYGNPYELSYTSHEFLGYTGRLKYLDRFVNFFWIFVDLYERGSYLLPAHYDLAKKNSIVPASDLPHIREMERNVSLVLLNSHFSISGVKPFLPGMVEIGGVHMDHTQKLTPELKKILDNATDGVIYFSFGSVINSKFLNANAKKMFLNVFSGLKQKVIWKWDEDHMEGKPDNVILAKWLPQLALLDHPNVKLFIMQGGGLSIQEAISKGVPVLCLPFYGDQYGNCANAKRLGYGESLAIFQLNEEIVLNTIKKLLTDSNYKSNALKVSSIYNDRPLSAIDTAVYWIEYVIRHQGASHLYSPAKDQYWYEYYSIDVILAVGLLVYYIFYILNWLWWNVALRKPINRDHLKDLRQQHMPKVPMKDD